MTAQPPPGNQGIPGITQNNNSATALSLPGICKVMLCSDDSNTGTCSKYLVFGLARTKNLNHCHVITLNLNLAISSLRSPEHLTSQDGLLFNY